MRQSLIALASVVALMATPCLALTISTAPNRDAVAHLQQQKASRGASLPAGFTESAERPQAGLGLTGGQTMTPGVTTFGFGHVRTTVIVDPDNMPPLGQRRETQAPLSLAPTRH